VEEKKLQKEMEEGSDKDRDIKEKDPRGKKKKRGIFGWFSR
jgi:hypothetical protein